MESFKLIHIQTEALLAERDVGNTRDLEKDMIQASTDRTSEESHPETKKLRVPGSPSPESPTEKDSHKQKISSLPDSEPKSTPDLIFRDELPLKRPKKKPRAHGIRPGERELDDLPRNFYRFNADGTPRITKGSPHPTPWEIRYTNGRIRSVRPRVTL
jgi:hypothetical protein